MICQRAPTLSELQPPSPVDLASTALSLPHLREEQRPGPSGCPDVPQARAHCACRRHRPGTFPCRLLRERADIPDVSCSYGPGRYDANYEQKGLDYPIGFVRWTEQRNFEAVLDMLSDGRVDVTPLISHRFAISDAGRAYEIIGGAEPSLAVLLTYPDAEAHSWALRSRTMVLPRRPSASFVQAEIRHPLRSELMVPVTTQQRP